MRRKRLFTTSTASRRDIEVDEVSRIGCTGHGQVTLKLQHSIPKSGAGEVLCATGSRRLPDAKLLIHGR